MVKITKRFEVEKENKEATNTMNLPNNIVERMVINHNCFYCAHCQRIKVNGLLVDRYCEKYLCLIDEVKDCQKFVHINNEVIELILDGIVEMHDGKREYAETLFNKAIKLLKGNLND